MPRPSSILCAGALGAMLSCSTLGGAYDQTIASGATSDVTVLGGDEGVAGGLQFTELEADATLQVEYAALGSETAGTFAAGLDLSLFGGESAQLWDVHYSGDATGGIQIVFNYDDTGMTPEEEEELLTIWHYTGGEWVEEGGAVDPVNNTITHTTYGFSVFNVASGTGPGTGSVPEPATLVLAALALAGVGTGRRRM